MYSDNGGINHVRLAATPGGFLFRRLPDRSLVWAGKPRLLGGGLLEVEQPPFRLGEGGFSQRAVGKVGKLAMSPGFDSIREF
jgi:hypothetical protein